MHLLRNSTVVIKLRQLSRVWLLNCFDGCQHVLSRKNIKIAYIDKIILIHENSASINGLFGLLSTISLNTKSRRISIYGPESLCSHVALARKYSKTSFRHKLYFYNLLSNKALIRQINSCLYPLVYAGSINHSYFSLLDFERSGIFNSNHAKNYNVPPGFLYSRLKTGQSFILPDGFSIHGMHFIHGYYLGCEIALLTHASRKRDVGRMTDAIYVIYD